MSRFRETFYGDNYASVPFWFMRQAGRYLPEYRALRAEAGSFLDLCYDPVKASEATLQPIRRFAMDAAIIFSDILVVPHAMGLGLTFAQGEGPKLEAVRLASQMEGWNTDIRAFLSPVYEAISLTRSQLPSTVSLIGFAGAPWTLACYMIEGGGGGEFVEARTALYRDPGFFLSLIDRVGEAVAQHLAAQAEAGADVLQLFDSWAGQVPASWRREAVYAPTWRIVKEVKRRFPKTPIIGFPRGMGHSIGEYVSETGVDGVSVDVSVPLEHVLETVPQTCVVQGNLDPLLLATDKTAALQQAERLLTIMAGRRYVFNLGHGMLPHTPIENVAALSARLRAEKSRACA